MSNNTVPLDAVLTAREFRAVFTPVVDVESEFTEANNEDRTFADYISDIETVCARILSGEIEINAR